MRVSIIIAVIATLCVSTAFAAPHPDGSGDSASFDAMMLAATEDTPDHPFDDQRWNDDQTTDHAKKAVIDGHNMVYEERQAKITGRGPTIPGTGA